jgi:transposase
MRAASAKRKACRTDALAGAKRCPSWRSPRARPTPRRTTSLVLRCEAKRTEDEAQQLAQLRAQHAAVDEAIDLAEDFATLARQRQPEHLDPLLRRATTSTLEALQRFANGFRDDYAPLKAGVKLPWRSGPVEGHINRLNMLQCQMFCPTRLDLLSQKTASIERRSYSEDTWLLGDK